jgi:hypothetical protein
MTAKLELVPAAISIFVDHTFCAKGRTVGVAPLARARATLSPKEHTMDRRTLIRVCAMAALGIALLPSSALAQQKSLKEQLTGAWNLVSIENTMPDGKKSMGFGPNPKGILIFDASGRYSQAQMRGDRAKFKSADRTVVTAEESKKAMDDSLAQLGNWSADETSKTITLRIESSLVPNGDGTEGKRVNVSVTGDELKFSNPGPASGGRNDSVYRRAK